MLWRCNEFLSQLIRMLRGRGYAFIRRWCAFERRLSMLRTIKQLYGYQIRETDDVMGSVKDFYFDDESWTIRYLVVDLGGLLPGRHVLISPEAMGQPHWKTMSFPVSLTLNQVKRSPDIDTARPVSREQEIELRRYYSWPLYWGGFASPAGPLGYWPSAADVAAEQAAQQETWARRGK